MNVALTCLANVDAEEISKSFERNGEGAADENPLGEAAKGYEPPKPVANNDADSGDIVITLDNAPNAPNVAYGTFSDSPSAKTAHSTVNQIRTSQFDGSDSKEDAKENEKVRPATVPPHNIQSPIPHILRPTTIDTDID